MNATIVYLPRLGDTGEEEGVEEIEVLPPIEIPAPAEPAYVPDAEPVPA